jgi:hypothetical protein
MHAIPFAIRKRLNFGIKIGRVYRDAGADAYASVPYPLLVLCPQPGNILPDCFSRCQLLDVRCSPGILQSARLGLVGQDLDSFGIAVRRTGKVGFPRPEVHIEPPQQLVPVSVMSDSRERITQARGFSC